MKNQDFPGESALKVANYDINKIEYAYELACKQENIRNLIGWMTSAIQNGMKITQSIR